MAAAPLTVAVMQPYFFSYAGYYRLLAAADLFLIFDCVQFIRRGRIHRCELPSRDGHTEWLTLPLAAAPRETPIHAMRLAADAHPVFAQRVRQQPWIAAGSGPAAHRVRGWLADAADGGSLVDYLEYTLRETAALLGLGTPFLRTSTLALAPGLRGAARVMAAVRAVGGSHFVNPPGGVGLYDPQAFAAAGLRLSFLAPYGGRFPHMLPALLQQAPQAIADDIRHSTVLVPG